MQTKIVVLCLLLGVSMEWIMKKQEYKIEGHIYVPLAELFEGEANEIGHQAHL